MPGESRSIVHEDGRQRSDISVGAMVKIELKRDQGTGKLIKGRVEEVLTRSSFHPHGIKVRIEDGNVGRVRQIG
ncbi:MAG: YwbE family protein [Methanomicrobiales archaeon]|nr:YwbE family protein [Methanomicrobiales archaeon]